MLRSAKKLAELDEVLSKGSRNDIEKMITSLRDSEPFEGVLKLLATFYDKTEDEGLRLHISSFFNDIKERSSRQEVMEALENAGSQATKAMLAASCWQSGLDYSEYAVSLSRIYAEGDFVTSLECFTVLETCAATISDADRKQIIRLLQKAPEITNEAKTQLTAELISVLKEG